MYGQFKFNHFVDSILPMATVLVLITSEMMQYIVVYHRTNEFESVVVLVSHAIFSSVQYNFLNDTRLILSKVVKIV